MNQNQSNQTASQAASQLQQCIDDCGGAQALAAKADQVQLTDEQRNQLRQMASQIKLIAPEGEGYAAIGDGTLLRIILENLPMLLQILAQFFSQQPQPNPTP